MSSPLDRENEAVRLLALHRYLTHPQLQELLLAGSMLTPRSRQVVTWRLLGRLQRQGLVAATPRQTGGAFAGSSLPGYFLTTSGLRLAARICPDLPTRRPARRGTFLMAHSFMTTDVELALGQAARAHEEHELELWEADWQIAMRIGRRTAVLPDARFAYRAGRRRLDAFVEVDLGTEGTKFFARKIERYVDLFRSGSWREFVPRLPLILTVAPSGVRAASLCGAAVAALRSKHVLIEATGVFRFISIGELRDAADPLAALWRVAGDDKLGPLRDPLATAADGDPRSAVAGDAARTVPSTMLAGRSGAGRGNDDDTPRITGQVDGLA